MIAISLNYFLLLTSNIFVIINKMIFTFFLYIILYENRDSECIQHQRSINNVPINYFYYKINLILFFFFFFFFEF